MNRSIPLLLQDGTNTYIYGLGLISQTDGAGNQTYLLGDGLGSTDVLTDASGSAIASYRYDAFGAVWQVTGPASTEYRFTGQQWDAALGYTYLRARYYDATIGRFLSRDPFPGTAADPASRNRYVYTANDPVNGVDPSGLFTEKDTAGNDCFSSPFGEKAGTVFGIQCFGMGILTSGQMMLRLPGGGYMLVPGSLAMANPGGGGGGGNPGQVGRGRGCFTPAPGMEIVERAMSWAELAATKATGLVRGGRPDVHFVSDAVNSNALRARQRLALDRTPEVRVTLQVPEGVFSPPSKLLPKNGMPGGGTERSATGMIRAGVLAEDPY